MRIIHKNIIYFCALFISIIAAGFSVYGLGKLFSSYAVYVMIMASAIELAKIIIMSIVFQYWSDIKSMVIRGFLLVSFLITVFITSLGVYGFLTNAYEQTVSKYELNGTKISFLDEKIKNFNQIKFETKQELDRVKELTNEKNDLLLKLRSTTERSSNTISEYNINRYTRDLKREISELKSEQNKLNAEITMCSDSINKISEQKLENSIASDETKELGPLRFITELSGKPMRTIVNWLVLFLVFVFDPLAISLIIFLNQFKNKKVISENIPNIVLKEDAIAEPNPVEIEHQGEPKITKLMDDKGGIRAI